MDSINWMTVLVAAIPAVLALLLAGHAWLKAHASQTATKVDDYALAAFDMASDIAAHNSALAGLVAKSPNKLDDAALALLQKIADSNEKMAAQPAPAPAAPAAQPTA